MRASIFVEPQQTVPSHIARAEPLNCHCRVGPKTRAYPQTNQGRRLMKAILNRAITTPTARRWFGYSLYLAATVLFSATTVYAQGMPSTCRWGWIDAGQTKQGWVCKSRTGQSTCRRGWIDAGQTKQGWVCNSPTGRSTCRWGWIDADQTQQGWVCN